MWNAIVLYNKGELDLSLSVNDEYRALCAVAGGRVEHVKVAWHRVCRIENFTNLSRPPIFSQYMVTYEWEPCRCTVANRPTRMAMSWQQGVRGQLEIVEHKSYPRNQRSLVKHLCFFLFCLAIFSSHKYYLIKSRSETTLGDVLHVATQKKSVYRVGLSEGKTLTNRFQQKTKSPSAPDATQQKAGIGGYCKIVLLETRPNN